MTGRTEKAILAGGCFWGLQNLIRRRPGVLSTRVGYTGGEVANATRSPPHTAESADELYDAIRDSFIAPLLVP
jgi:peptide-methionine (S)-S-oxide reductase